MIVVFPVPGPPVIIDTLSEIAFLIASICLCARRSSILFWTQFIALILFKASSKNMVWCDVAKQNTKPIKKEEAR